jgi:hypothetical protein
MPNFIEMFTAARKAGTPIIAVRTPDATSTIGNVRKSLDNKELYAKPGQENAGLCSWDAVHGLRGMSDNKKGHTEVAQMMRLAEIAEPGMTVSAAVAFGVLEFANAQSDLICFAHNAHLLWSANPPDIQIVQSIWNLRDGFKANGNLLVLLINLGATLPIELTNDILLLEEQLPSRAQLETTIKETFEYAKVKAPTAEVLRQAGDALIGLPSFPSEESVARNLNKNTGELDIEGLWGRKRSIVGQMPGLKFHTGLESLADIAGVEQIINFGKQLFAGKRAPSLILRMDEAEKQLAGNATDTSGVKGDLLGEFLTWVEDRKIFCTLLLGVPGSSKSWFTYCIGGEYKRPVINYSISAMQSQYVGTSGSNMRAANNTIDAISDGNIWLLATANSLNGMPPELISRFQRGGIYFFDAPNEEERRAIMKLKIAKYGLDPKQTLPCTVDWTGRDIENCAFKADALGISLLEAAKHIVPLLKSHKEEMTALRMSVHNRFLSANHPGEYQYHDYDKVMAQMEKSAPAPVAAHARRMRD